MNRIEMLFEKIKNKGEKALITFITAGDPDLDTTERLVYAMEEAGADIIELGVPFSDPVAEGPIIQAASGRGLQSGTKLSDIFMLVARLRCRTQMPLLLMMYLNSIFRFGPEKFFEECSKNGIDGVIVPDMPFEEKDEIAVFAEKYNVLLIDLVAPTSKKRIKMIASQSRGFLYCVSSLGVTGQRSSFSTDFKCFFEEIDRHSNVPTAIGFGISTAEQVKELRGYATALIVGSAIVKIVEAYGKDSVMEVKRFVRELKAALNEK
ncbi:MAG: tryptophan synthase subunit alpha [Eubacteriales bacterium]|nr:tryptophan synthase subunit alpha [Eubacteriales bacterium]MDD3349876.1 tryptophan synthase subunit alpha [Eubacteriales bacterium]